MIVPGGDDGSREPDGAAPNEFTKDYLENRLRLQIAAALSEELGRDIRVAVTVQNAEERAESANNADIYAIPDDEEWEPPRPVQLHGGYSGRGAAWCC